MCGIAAYAGKNQAAPFLAEALKRLEYRGYDSWGILTLNGNDREDVRACKDLGAPSVGIDLLRADRLEGTVGIAHTRWATHGTVCLKNTHPIAGTPPPPSPGADAVATPTVWVAHNGIVRNHSSLREVLEWRGVRFDTDTDTECIAHLLASHLHDGLPMFQALSRMASELAGEYAFVAVSRKYPGQVGFVANGCPLYVTMEGFAASDPTALAGYARTAYAMKPGDIGVLHIGGRHNLPRVAGHIEVPQVGMPALDGHAFYMHQEIHDQARVVERLAGEPLAPPKSPSRVLFGCGSSYNAALLGRRYFGKGCRAEYATELADFFEYEPDTSYLALTQSGETRDTLRALAIVKGDVPQGTDVRVLTTSDHSTAAGLAEPIILNCGPEFGVAATKTFTASVVRLWQMANAWRGHAYCNRSLRDLANSIRKMLTWEDEVSRAASWLTRWHNILYLGRGLLYPVAREGALKMKEVSYRHAEAILASEMKHGPIALIDDCTLTVLLFGQDDQEHTDRILANVEEVQARGGVVVAVADESVADRLKNIPRVLRVPRTADPELSPLVANVALQLLAYHAALHDGRNVDKPRNLAKSVTVE